MNKQINSLVYINILIFWYECESKPTVETYLNTQLKGTMKKLILNATITQNEAMPYKYALNGSTRDGRSLTENNTNYELKVASRNINVTQDNIVDAAYIIYRILYQYFVRTINKYLIIKVKRQPENCESANNENHTKFENSEISICKGNKRKKRLVVFNKIKRQPENCESVNKENHAKFEYGEISFCKGNKRKKRQVVFNKIKRQPENCESANKENRTKFENSIILLSKGNNRKKRLPEDSEYLDFEIIKQSNFIPAINKDLINKGNGQLETFESNIKKTIQLENIETSLSKESSTKKRPPEDSEYADLEIIRQSFTATNDLQNSRRNRKEITHVQHKLFTYERTTDLQKNRQIINKKTTVVQYKIRFIYKTTTVSQKNRRIIDKKTTGLQINRQIQNEKATDLQNDRLIKNKETIDSKTKWLSENKHVVVLKNNRKQPTETQPKLIYKTDDIHNDSDGLTSKNISEESPDPPLAKDFHDPPPTSTSTSTTSLAQARQTKQQLYINLTQDYEFNQLAMEQKFAIVDNPANPPEKPLGHFLQSRVSKENQYLSENPTTQPVKTNASENNKNLFLNIMNRIADFLKAVIEDLQNKIG